VGMTCSDTCYRSVSSQPELLHHYRVHNELLRIAGDCSSANIILNMRGHVAYKPEMRNIRERLVSKQEGRHCAEAAIVL
jgi:hypothetical protein